MESRIEELLEKYWEGETTLDEEAELKVYFAKNPSLAPTGQFFRTIQTKSEKSSARPFRNPGAGSFKTRFSIAATISIGILVGAYVIQNPAQNDEFEIDDPQEAYEIARTALMKMSAGLNEGKTHSEQLQKLNKAEEIIKEEQL